MRWILEDKRRRFNLMLGITIVICGNGSEGQSCNNRIFQHGQYNYKIFTNQVLISDALQLADREGSSLLVIEDETMETIVLEQMEMCDISEVWLGIKQIPPANLLTDSGKWKFISDCDRVRDGLIKYQGCYNENDADPEMPLDSGIPSANVQETACATACRELDQPYTAIQKSSSDVYSCYCGQSFGKHGVATGCSYACQFGIYNGCGGLDRNSVYLTRKENKLVWGNWFENHPAYNTDFPLCAYISRNRGHSSNYYLKDGSCGEKRRFLCTSPSENGVCINQEGYAYRIMRRNTCYYLSEDEKIWEKAKYLCRTFGEFIAIQDEAEHAFLIRWLEDINENRYKDVWVGMTRITFKRLDNNIIVCYSNFNTKVKLEHTNVYIERRDGELLWQVINNDESQSKLAATITQYPISSTQPTTSSTQVAISSTQPSTSSTQPTTSFTQPTTSSTQPTTSSTQATINSTQPTTSYTQPTSDREFEVESTTDQTEQQLITTTEQLAEEVNQSASEAGNVDGQSSFPTWLVAVIVIFALLFTTLIIYTMVYFWKKKKEESDSLESVTTRKKDFITQKKLRKKPRITNNKLRKAVLDQIKLRKTGSISDNSDSSHSNMDHSTTTFQGRIEQQSGTDTNIEVPELMKEEIINISTQASVRSIESGTVTSEDTIVGSSTISTVSEMSGSSSNTFESSWMLNSRRKKSK